jgi:hypothetical protein
MEFNINLFIFLPFQSIDQSIFLYFKSPLWKVSVLLLKIIKLLMYNQFQILNLISFIICYRCPKKRHFTKMCIMTQKVSHLNVHSPIQVIQLNFKKILIMDHGWSLAKMNKNGRSIEPIFKNKEKHKTRLCAKIAFKSPLILKYP